MSEACVDVSLKPTNVCRRRTTQAEPECKADITGTPVGRLRERWPGLLHTDQATSPTVGSAASDRDGLVVGPELTAPLPDRGVS